MTGTGLADEAVARLRDAARVAAANAYAPYSGFRVGAACIGNDGRIHCGSNVENASYGLTICAERNAIFQAVAAGQKKIRALLVYTPTPEPVTPCGACRQVICEFGDGIRVICCCDGTDVREFMSGDLLPDRFML